jgi:hypothetical protein
VWDKEHSSRALECIAPNVNVTPNSTVLLQLALRLPASANASWALVDATGQAGGWRMTSNTSGPLALGPAMPSSTDGWTDVPLFVPGVGVRQRASGAYSLVTHELMFTYTNSDAECGCDLDPTSACDDCLVCRRPTNGTGTAGNASANSTEHAEPASRDCEGTCLGMAAVDDCGVCAGGFTGKWADADKDCEGVCFGTATDCGGGGGGGGVTDDGIDGQDDWIPTFNDDPATPDSPDGSQTVTSTTAAITMAMAACVVLSLLVCCVAMRANAPLDDDGGPAQNGGAANGSDGLGMPAYLPTVPFDPSESDDVPARNRECPISMEPFVAGERVVRLPCEHQFTPTLIHQSLLRARRCPLCRTDHSEWLEVLASDEPDSSPRRLLTTIPRVAVAAAPFAPFDHRARDYSIEMIAVRPGPPGPPALRRVPSDQFQFESPFRVRDRP